MAKIPNATILIAVLAVAAVAVCAVVYLADDQDPKITTKVLGPGPYEGYYLDVTLKDFESIGIVPGDDVRVEYSGGTIIAMLSNFYNGIPSYMPYITYDKGIANMGLFNGVIRETVKLDEGDTLTLSREGKNKYVDKMPKFLAGFSEDPADYASLEVFSNFRELSGGDIAPDSVYRSASPWTAGTRSAYADDFYRTQEIDYMICMDMDAEKAESYSKEFPDAYVSELFREGKVICKQLHPSNHSHPEDCRFVLEAFLETDGKVGLFCKWGKDRTGIYLAVLEGLAGATYDEIVADYMMSFCNYYGIEVGSEEYETVKEILISRNLYLFEHPELIDHLEKVDWSNVEFEKFDPEMVFTKYIVDQVGLNQETVQKVKDKITGKG